MADANVTFNAFVLSFEDLDAGFRTVNLTLLGDGILGMIRKREKERNNKQIDNKEKEN